MDTDQCSELLFPQCRYSWGSYICVRTNNSVKVFVEAYVSCNGAYSCAIPLAIVEVVCGYFKSLRVVIAKYKISMCVSVRVPSFMC